MSTKVQKFHLSAECREILYRLRYEAQFLLDKDITSGFACKTRSLGNLLPLVYMAYHKLWLPKDKFLVVKKSYRTFVGFSDNRQVLVDYGYFERLLHESNLYRELVKKISKDLSL